MTNKIFEIRQKETGKRFGQIEVADNGVVGYRIENPEIFSDTQYPDRVLLGLVSDCKDALGRIFNFIEVDGKILVDPIKPKLMPGLDSTEIISKSVSTFMKGNGKVYDIIDITPEN